MIIFIYNFIFFRAFLFLQMAVYSIHGHLSNVREHQEFIRMQEAKDRNIAESNYHRVNQWSMWQLLVMAIVSGIQVIMIRSLFDEKSRLHQFWKRLCWSSSNISNFQTSTQIHLFFGIVGIQCSNYCQFWSDLLTWVLTVGGRVKKHVWSLWTCNFWVLTHYFGYPTLWHVVGQLRVLGALARARRSRTNELIYSWAFFVSSICEMKSRAHVSSTIRILNYKYNIS